MISDLYCGNIKLGSVRYSLTSGISAKWLERTLTKWEVPGSIPGRVTTMDFSRSGDDCPYPKHGSLSEMTALTLDPRV